MGILERERRKRFSQSFGILEKLIWLDGDLGLSSVFAHTPPRSRSDQIKC